MYVASGPAILAKFCFEETMEPERLLGLRVIYLTNYGILAAELHIERPVVVS